MRERTQADRHEEQPTRPLLLGSLAPDFEAESTHGALRLYEWNPEKWVVFFSHPADFTPVCTSEFLEFARHHQEFANRQTALLALSVDSVYSHLAWKESIRENFDLEIPFPIIADVDQHIARLYGMIHAPSLDVATVRALYIFDPERRIRASFFYPEEVGRSVQEALRLLEALQTADRHRVKCPSDWKPGQAVVSTPPRTAEGLKSWHLQDHQKATWYYTPTSLEDK